MGKKWLCRIFECRGKEHTDKDYHYITCKWCKGITRCPRYIYEYCEALKKYYEYKIKNWKYIK